MKELKLYINESRRIDDSNFSIVKRYAMTHKKKYKNKKTESQDKYFSEQEKGKIMKDMWDKDGLFYKFMKDKVDKFTNEEIVDYLYTQCLNDDRCAAEFASYIAKVIGRNNFSIKQVQNFINREDLKG